MAPVIDPQHAQQYGLDINEHGSAYKRGSPYPIEKKLVVVTAANRYKAEGKPISNRQIARETGFGRCFVTKVLKELDTFGRVLEPKESRQILKSPTWVGCRCMDGRDAFVLLRLRQENPQRTLLSYKENLAIETGTIVSETTISEFFKNGFPFKGNLRKTSKVPIDKYKPENIERALEYIALVGLVDPWRLKFADEKPLKGEDLYLSRVRGDPITGEVPTIIVDPDFRNTYNIFGICGIEFHHPHRKFHSSYVFDGD